MPTKNTNLPICSVCGRRGTFPASSDGSDMAEYRQYHTSHGYAYCEVCSGANHSAVAPDGESVPTFPVPTTEES